MEIIFSPLAPWHTYVSTLMAFTGCVLLLVCAWRVGRGSRPLANLTWTRVIVVSASLLAGGLLTAAAWNPVLRFPEAQLPFHAVVVLDVSESTLRNKDQWEASLSRFRTYVGTLPASLPVEERGQATASIVTFGADVQLASAVSSHPEAIPLGDLLGALGRLTVNDYANGQNTNIAQALVEAGRRIDLNGGRGVILLATDGNQTEGDALSEAVTLGNQGIPVYVFPLSGTGTATAITAAYLPSYIQAGATSYLRAVLRQTGTGAVSTLSVSRNTGLVGISNRVGIAQSVTGTVPVANAATSSGDSWPYIRYPISFEGRGLQFVDMILAGNDGLPDQVRRLYTYVDAPQRILALGGDNRWMTAVSSDLAQIVNLSLNDLPSVNLSDYDGVVISGLPASALPQVFLQKLADQVQTNGLRLWLLNGDHGQADEKQATVIMSYADTPVGPLLPVSGQTKDKQPPTRQVIVIIDTSGSMQGWPLEKAKEITRHIVSDLLRDQDTLQLIAFSDQAVNLLSPEVLTLDKEGKAKVLAALDAIPVGGGTDPATAINLLAQRQDHLTNCGIIFISDGEFGDASWVSQRPDCWPTVFKVGAGGDDSAIRLLADPITVTETTRAGDIKPQYFEARAIFFDKTPFQPLLVDEISGVQVADQEIGGWAITEPVADAVVPIVVQKFADPVLAFRPAGAGGVTALTTGIPPNWLSSDQGRAAVRSWFHYAFPDETRGRYHFEVQDSGTSLGLRVSVVNQETGEPVQLNRLSVWLDTPGVVSPAPVWLEADSTQAHYVGTLPTQRTEQAQIGFLTIQESGVDALLQPQRIPIIVPPAGVVQAALTSEAFSDGTNSALLQALADRTRGLYGAEPHFDLGISAPQGNEIALWPGLVIVAACFYWLAFALPRVGL